MTDDHGTTRDRIGDREGFTEWMDEVMGELGDRGHAGDDAPRTPGETTLGPDPAGEQVDRRPRRRLLRWRSR